MRTLQPAPRNPNSALRFASARPPKSKVTAAELLQQRQNVIVLRYRNRCAEPIGSDEGIGTMVVFSHPSRSEAEKAFDAFLEDPPDDFWYELWSPQCPAAVAYCGQYAAA